MQYGKEEEVTNAAECAHQDCPKHSSQHQTSQSTKGRSPGCGNVNTHAPQSCCEAVCVEQQDPSHLATEYPPKTVLRYKQSPHYLGVQVRGVRVLS